MLGLDRTLRDLLQGFERLLELLYFMKQLTDALKGLRGRILLVERIQENAEACDVCHVKLLLQLCDSIENTLAIPILWVLNSNLAFAKRFSDC